MTFVLALDCILFPADLLSAYTTYELFWDRSYVRADEEQQESHSLVVQELQEGRERTSHPLAAALTSA